MKLCKCFDAAAATLVLTRNTAIRTPGVVACLYLCYTEPDHSVLLRALLLRPDAVKLLYHNACHRRHRRHRRCPQPLNPSWSASCLVGHSGHSIPHSNISHKPPPLPRPPCLRLLLKLTPLLPCMTLRHYEHRHDHARPQRVVSTECTAPEPARALRALQYASLGLNDTVARAQALGFGVWVPHQATGALSEHPATRQSEPLSPKQNAISIPTGS